MALWRKFGASAAGNEIGLPVSLERPASPLVSDKFIVPAGDVFASWLAVTVL